MLFDVFDIRSMDTADSALARLQWNRAKREVPFKTLLMLARFDPSGDPLSGKAVQPDDLASAFGAGVRLTRATMQITDDPVTWYLERRLPWISELRGSIAHAYKLDGDYERSLGLMHDGAFSQGSQV
jgi:hypothetical protein